MKYYKTYKGSEHHKQAQKRLDTDKQLFMNLNCQHPDIEEEEVYRADQPDEAPYYQTIRRCTKCKKEIIN